MAELAVFAVPFNVMSFLPNFYFGGLTAWIGQDILKARLCCACGGLCRFRCGLHALTFRAIGLVLQDWLFIAAKRISAVEYVLLLATFSLVMAAGLEAGIAAGIVLAALHFAYRCGGAARLLRVWLWFGKPCVSLLQLLAGNDDGVHCGAESQRRRHASLAIRCWWLPELERVGSCS